MSEQPSSDDVVTFGGLGGPAGPGRSRFRPTGRSRRFAIGVSVAAVAMLGGAGVAYAASASGGSGGSGSATATPAVKQSAIPCPRPSSASKACAVWRQGAPFRGRFVPVPGFGPWPMLGAGPLGAVHGQFVVAKPGGGYQTIDEQRGKVTAVSSSSITVRSPDGFSASYAVSGSTVVDAQRDGIGSVKTGDQVTIEAKVSGSTATAASILDLTRVAAGHKSFGFGWSATNSG